MRLRMKLGVLLCKNPLHTRISFCLNGVFQIENFQQGTQQLIQRFSSKDHVKYASEWEAWTLMHTLFEVERTHF